MNIKLQSLTLRNFKGVRDLTLILNGRDATVYGPNGAGKTSIVDAFLWLLFNKDSDNRGQFEIKTLDANNQPIHNLEHEVEATLTIDGRRLFLRKRYKEIWKRPRGKSQPEFDGHTTDYWINEAPAKAKDYNDYVAGLISDELFRLITNPLYFSTKLHWEARRKILLGICGEISQDTVIAAGGEPLMRLRELLGDLTIEATQKVLQDKRRNSINELDKIPAQIEAINRTLPALLNDYTVTEAELAARKNEIADIDAQMLNANRALEPILEKGRLLTRLEKEQSDIAIRMERDATTEYDNARQNRERLEAQLNNQDSSITSIRAELGRLESKLVDADAELQSLRKDHENEYQTAFVEPSENEYICRSCGQELPAGKRAELLNNARNRFDSQKTAAMEAIEAKGLKARDAFEALKSEITYNETELDKSLRMRDTIHGSCEGYRLAEQQLKPTGNVNYASNPRYTELGKQIVALRTELETPYADTTEEIKAKRITVNERIEGLSKVLSDRDTAIRSQEVIAGYSKRERELSDNLSELEGQLYILETYIRTEAEMLEKSVNSRFKTISFRLFEEQVSGGLRPTCEAVIGGVQFSEANTAACYNAGMEIIDALCAHYGAYAPVFVDRCESINNLAPIKAQVIRMVVSKDGEMPDAAQIPGAVIARAARGDVCIQTENSKQEVA